METEFPRKQVLLSAVISLYFFFVAVWLSPDSHLRTRLVVFIRPVLVGLGLDQYWNMFAPMVRTTNANSSAVVTFADGSTKLYECPRLNMLDMFERSRRQKLTKTFLEGWERPDQAYYLPYLARFVARCNLNPRNEPNMVSIALNWSPIPPIETETSREALPENTNRATTFVYKVRPEDLR